MSPISAIKDVGIGGVILWYDGKEYKRLSTVVALIDLAEIVN